MQIIISILTLSLLITPLVILHELGHYFTAKFYKVRVLEFGIGFPPRFFSFWSQKKTYNLDKNLGFDISILNQGEKIYIEINSEKKITKIETEKSYGNSPSFIPVKIIEIFSDKLMLNTMTWSLNMIPFGGFVKLFGEEKNRAKDSLSQASYLGRFIIIFSGSLINFILPFILMFIVNIFILEKNVSDVIIEKVMDNSPASIAGLKPGDKIVSINQENIYSIGDLQNIITQNLGTKSDWKIVRGIPKVFMDPGQKSKYEYDDTLTLNFQVLGRWNPPSYKIGKDISLEKARQLNPYSGSITSFVISNEESDRAISLDVAKQYSDYEEGDFIPIVLNENHEGIPIEEARKINIKAGITNIIKEGSVGVQISTQNKRLYRENAGENLKTAISKSFSIYKLSYFSILGIFNKSSNPIFEGPKAIGPIGLGQISGSVVSSTEGFTYKLFILVTLASSISLSLSIINLIPFPALDGGRLAFLFVEIIRKGKKVPERIESYIHGLGFIILILLIIFISFKDISRL